MYSLPTELLQIVNSFLDKAKDSVSFLSITKKYHDSKNKFTFHLTEEEEDGTLKYLWYYKNIKWAYYVDSSKEIENIPKNVTCIHYDSKLDTPLPNHINHLIVGRYSKLSRLNVNISSIPIHLQHYYTTIIPSSVKEITFSRFYEHSLSKYDIPSHIKKIRFNDETCGLKDFIPFGVEELYIEEKIDYDFLPKTVKKIVFGKYASFTKLSEIPIHVTYINLGPRFNVRIGKKCLSNGLEQLYFGKDFQHPIGLDILPYTITHLGFHKDYKFYLSKEVLPYNLKYLEVPKAHEWFYQRTLKGIEIKYVG